MKKKQTHWFIHSGIKRLYCVLRDVAALLTLWLCMFAEQTKKVTDCHRSVFNMQGTGDSMEQSLFTIQENKEGWYTLTLTRPNDEQKELIKYRGRVVNWSKTGAWNQLTTKEFN